MDEGPHIAMRGAATIGVAAVAVLAIGCGETRPATPATPATPSVTVAPRPSGSAPSPEASDVERMPAIPEAVARFHRKAFAMPSPKLGRPIFLVTMHGGGRDEGQYHALVLFESGVVGTWQHDAGETTEQLFSAKLTDESLQAIEEQIGAITPSQTRAPTSEPEATVVGVSLHDGEATVTSFFAADDVPPEVTAVVGQLKRQLEMANQGR